MSTSTFQANPIALGDGRLPAESVTIPLDALGRILDNLFAAGLRLAVCGHDPVPGCDTDHADYIRERLDFAISEIRRAALMGRRADRITLARPFANGHFGS